jgi:rhodanese-related sulfurtransferase
MLARLLGRGGMTDAEAKALIERGAQVVDVRGPAEFRAGAHSGCVNIPLDQLEARVGELDPGRPVLLCCESGARGGFAEGLLRRRGFGDVHNLGSWRRLRDLA